MRISIITPINESQEKITPQKKIVCYYKNMLIMDIS